MRDDEDQIVESDSSVMEMGECMFNGGGFRCEDYLQLVLCSDWFD